MPRISTIRFLLCALSIAGMALELVVSPIGSVADFWRLISHTPALWLLPAMAVLSFWIEPAAPQQSTHEESEIVRDDLNMISEMAEFLEQTNSRARELFDMLPVACLTYDERGHVIEWNRACAALFGQTAGRTLDRPFSEIEMLAPIKEIAEKSVRRVLAGDPVESEEWSIPATESHLMRYLTAYAYPLRSTDGAIVGAICAVIDITAQKKIECALQAANHEMEERVAARTAELRELNEGLQASYDEILSAKNALESSEQRSHFLTESMPLIVWTTPADSVPTYYNRKWYEFTGLTEEQCKRGGSRLAMHPEDVVHCNNRYREAVSKGQPGEFEYRLLRASDGTYRWHLGRIVPMRDATGEIVMWLGTGTDIDDQKRAAEELRAAYEELEHRVALRTSELARANESLLDEVETRMMTEKALQESDDRFRSAIASMQEGFIIQSLGGEILECNDAAEKILGLTSEQITGLGSAGFVWGMVREDHSPIAPDAQPLALALSTSTIQKDVVVGVYRATGELIWLSQTAVPLRHADQSVPHAVLLTFTDITERRRIEDQLARQMRKLEKQATIDGLTGLRNHRAFQETLELERRRALRSKKPLSLLMLDVDLFKSFNDAFGHPAGDEVLITVAGALQKAARTTDTIARYGGEEFAVILPESDMEEAIVAAERLRTAIEEAQWPLRPITATFGAATLAKEWTSADLLKAADSALYAAKNSGRNCTIHAGDLTSADRKAA